MGKKLHNYVKSSRAEAAQRTGKTSVWAPGLPTFVDTWRKAGERSLNRPRIYDINREQDYAKNSEGILGENELSPPSQLHSLLEKTETGFISEKIFEAISLSSDSVFQKAVSILHTAYLDSASEHGFQYSQVTLVKNDIFLNEYKTFYQEKKASNYTQEELQETYGFLLFETENQAKLACQYGLCIGSSAITTLGDPAKGVYISRYSDYLHARPWYHGKSGYVVIFNLIKGKVKFVPENYTTNYTSPSFGYDCHVAANTNKVSHKTSHFRTFELSQYYLYELSGSTVTERPRQLCPYVIVTFQYREPKKMATTTHKSVLEISENVLLSPWKGKLIIQGCLLCDITLWASCGTVIPAQLPHELDFKYVMQVSSLKKRLPEAVFKKQNYLEQKVCNQDMCFNLYTVELSNKQGEKIDQLTEYIKDKQLAIIKCLEDRGFFILLTSSALISETNNEDEQIGLHGLHLFCSSLTTEMKDLQVEEDISLKVIPILPALNCALLEAKNSFTEEGICLNTLVRHNFHELHKVDKSPLTASSQDGIKETAFCDKLSNGFDLVPPAEKCPLQSLTQLKSYLSDPSGYVLEVSTTLDLLAECPQSPCISDGICDAGFSLVMTPDPEFLDSETEVRKETETEKNSEGTFKTRQRAVVPLSPPSTLRIQPKRKASTLSAAQSKTVNFPKRTLAKADKISDSSTTLKLVKGQFPQKRKRGAEVLTAQFVQTTKLDRKTQEAPISKDVPVTTNVKRAKKQENTPVKTLPRAKPPVKKSPQKQRVNTVKDTQNPRIRKQPHPAKGENASQLQSENLSSGQADVISTSTAQPENITVAQKDLSESSIVNCDSQALNMLADLALSSAPSTTPSSEPRNSSELPQNEVLLSKEHSLVGTYDHEYHRGIKSQKGVLLPKLSSDKKSDLMSDFTDSQEKESVVSANLTPIETQPTLSEETLEISDASQSSFVAVEHSYASLLAEHSKKQLQQKGLPGSTFAKNTTKSPEVGTPVGKVMPFRHQQISSPLQKFSEEPLLKCKSELLPSNLKDFYCSHTVLSCDGSFKVTFKCETEYLFSLDSKYTNNPLEKTVIRALHGPWNTDLPDNVEEVKLLLHMWVALFYSNQNKVIRSSRRVVEHSNPAKYVSINSTLESLEFGEIEESNSVQRCSADPVLETDVAPGTCTALVPFPEPNTVLPVIEPPSVRGVGLWAQNEQGEMFARVDHPDTTESQNFIYSYNNEVIGGKAQQESSNNLETSSLNSIQSQTSIPSISHEDKALTPLDNTTVNSYNDTVTQTIVTKTYDGVSSQSVICQKSVYNHNTLENKVDVFHAAVHTNTGASQELIQHSSPMNEDCQPSLEKKDDNKGYEMINLDPVTLTFDEDAYGTIQAETINRAEKTTAFGTELIKQVSPAIGLRHPVSTFEKPQTQGARDTSSLTVPGQQGNKYLCTSSVNKERLAKEICSLQPVPGSSSSNNQMAVETLSSVKSSNYLLPRKDLKLSQEVFLQTQSASSTPSEETVEPSQVDEVVSSASATLGKNHLLSCIPSVSNMSDGFLELKNHQSGQNSENLNFESCNSAFTKQTSQSVNREEVNLELSEEDSDINLTLTISPPTSPREAVTAGKMEQDQEAPLTNVELQGVTEEIIEPEQAMCREKKEVTFANYTPMCPTVSKKPLENERKGDYVQPATLILPKESCSLETEEVRVPADFLFASLIEEVSPASSPGPPVLTEEIQPSQTMSLCSLKLPDAQCEKNDTFSQVESVDLAIKEKENSFISPLHPVGQENLTQIEQMQLSAEMPLVLNNHSGEKERHLITPSKVSENIISSVCDEDFSFLEKTPHCGTNKAASVAIHRDDFKLSLEKRVRSGNPLQCISMENRNLNLNHLVLESSEFPFTPRNTENKTSADKVVSVTAPGGVVNISLKEQTSPKSTKKNLFSSDLKTNEGNYMQFESLNSKSVNGIDVSHAQMHFESPKLASASDSTLLPHCSRPVYGEVGLQTQELSVARMASLPNSSETEAELHEKSIDVGVDSQSNISPKGEQETVYLLQDMSVCKTKALLSDGLDPVCADSYQNTAVLCENINEEPSASLVPKSCDPVLCGISKKQTENKMAGDGYRTKEESKTLGRDMDSSTNSDIHYEPLSGDSDEESFGNCRNPKFDVEDSCTSQCHAKEGEYTYHTLLHSNDSDDEDWGYSDQVPVLEASIPPENWYTGSKKQRKYIPRYIQIRDLHGTPRTYPNFTVTKEIQDTTRTFNSPSRHSSPSANRDLLSSWTDTWPMADDLTQHTLDLECLRFTHRIKQIIKNGGSRHSSSSTDIFPKESPFQVTAEAFPLRKRPASPLPLPVARSRSPLVVTITQSDTRQQSPDSRDHLHSDSDRFSFWKERGGHNRNYLTNSERNEAVSFHLNKLKYNSTLKESRNDISLILNEYAEFNKVMMNSNQVVFQNKEANVASGGATSPEMYTPFPQSASYEDMITDLCTSLHVKLKSVMKEACKSTFLFYLVETEEKSFFLRTKNILRKEGHREIEPQRFCQALQRENDTLLVIIRNEDISSHLHQIPSLLKLKHFPSVIFVGVDSPEDVLDYTYQELFQTGGFVVSDDKILETLTLVQLKEIVKILEKLNGNGRWKWLLHYRENKKLKEDIRVDSTARRKHIILKAYQSASIIELLHYHECDSRSSTKTEYLKCLLNLQIQHIHARFAVFLTEKLNSREVFESSGILVTDVNNFIENIQKVAAPFRTSYW